MSGIELLKDWYESVWVHADMDAVARYFDTEAMASGLMGDLVAQLEDFQTLVPAILHSVRDVEFTFDDTMEMGDKVWARMTMRAKKAEDLSPIEITGQIMIRVKEGKIIEAYNNYDFFAYFEQMGNLPKDSIALMLAGETLS